VVDDVVMATSREVTTELMVQKGIDEIVKYGSEILDFLIMILGLKPVKFVLGNKKAISFTDGFVI
jgi:hypothetical protein